MQTRSHFIRIIAGYKKSSDTVIAKMTEDITILVNHFFIDENNIVEHIAFFKSLNGLLGKTIEHQSATAPLFFVLVDLQRRIYLDLIKLQQTADLLEIYSSMKTRSEEDKRLVGLSNALTYFREDMRRSRAYPIMQCLLEIYRANVENENGSLFNELFRYIKTIKNETIFSQDEENIESINTLIATYNQIDKTNNKNRFLFESAKPIEEISGPSKVFNTTAIRYDSGL
jgi:hypothetical protein